MFDAASAPLLLVPRGDGGRHVLRDVCEVLMPGGSFCIFHALDYDGEGIGANALCQSTVYFVSDQTKNATENGPLEVWVSWGSNRTPGAYANAMRSTSKWGDGIELEHDAYRCISRFEFPGALETKRLLYCGRNHISVLKVVPKTMPKTGGKVAVELRDGSGSRADSGREAYVGIAMGVPSTG
jgi:hypothetical protein